MLFSMLLLTHITLAMGSICWSCYLLFRPTLKSLRISIGMTVATLISGTALTAFSHSSIIPACVSGLLYSLGTCAAILLANKRLAGTR